MALYRALFVAGFRRQATYRLALLSGLGTNVFFGIVRTALFLALYEQRGEVGGLDRGEALTYVWVIQCLFGVIWAPWIWELADSVRSGDVVAELTRPGDPFGRLLAFDLGRTVHLALVRATLPLAGAAVVLDLALPGSASGWALVAVSFGLATLVGFEVRFLFSASAFWTPDYRGVFSLAFPPLYLLGGFLLPVEFFPSTLRTVAEVSPLVAMLTAPVRVVTGSGAAEALAVQAGWALVLLVACRAVMGLAERRLVVHGG